MKTTMTKYKTTLENTPPKHGKTYTAQNNINK